MLPLKSRITKSADILIIKNKGQRISARYLTIFCLSNQATGPRFAFVAGKHVHKSAVVRHRYQRWMRAIAKDLLPRLHAPKDMVWVAKPGLNQVIDQKQLFQDIEKALVKSRLISNLPPVK